MHLCTCLQDDRESASQELPLTRSPRSLKKHRFHPQPSNSINEIHTDPNRVLLTISPSSLSHSSFFLPAHQTAPSLCICVDVHAIRSGVKHLRRTLHIYVSHNLHAHSARNSITITIDLRPARCGWWIWISITTNSSSIPYGRFSYYFMDFWSSSASTGFVPDVRVLHLHGLRPSRNSCCRTNTNIKEKRKRRSGLWKLEWK